MKKLTLLLLIILLILSTTAAADRGSIPFRPGVLIFEPNQDALVAWNGEEEILILSTELYASEPTKVLQVLPLPAEPEVKESSRDVLRRANEFLVSHDLLEISQPGFRSSRSDIMPGAELKEELVIGSHDISVVEVKNQTEFIDWVNNHLREKGEDNPTIPSELQQTINNYINRGYNFFVFDTVEVGPEPEFNEAISYRFKSDHLYYPLEITKSDHGVSDIRLIVVTDQNLINYTGISSERINILSGPAEPASDELAYISSSLADLFFDQNRSTEAVKKVEISTWQIVDDLANFEADLLVNGDLSELKENEISYQNRKYIGVQAVEDYPYPSDQKLTTISGRVEQQMGSRTHPWLAYAVEGRVLFDAKTRSFLENFDALGQDVIIKGYPGEGTVLMRDPIDRMGILIEIEDAFFVTEIEGWQPYTGFLVQQDGNPAEKRSAFWLQDN